MSDHVKDGKVRVGLLPPAPAELEDVRGLVEAFNWARGYQCGAAVAFGLIGMAEAIHRREAKPCP